MNHVMAGDNYVAFLIERRGLYIPTSYLALDNLLSVAWVAEADDALHFSRRSDAEHVVTHLPDAFGVCVVDHMWPGGTPRDRVVPYSEAE